MNLEQLDQEGYTVVTGFLDRGTTAAIRAITDAIAPPRQPKDAAGVRRVFDVRHPLDVPLLARLGTTPNLLALAQKSLHIRETQDLRMLEQVLIRTDPRSDGSGAYGWHVDQAFTPDQYESRPRRTYYHMVHACSTVEPGGGAFSIVPRSHHLTYAATKNLKTNAELDEFKKDPVKNAGIDVSKGIEVCANEGDLIIFNPMCLHSASHNNRDTPRYVYFASFRDKSATWLRDKMIETNYGPKFSKVFRDALPAERRHLLADHPE